jgi:D-alanyl-D-alanine endopeptidase (penicillin-binding protein 7)
VNDEKSAPAVLPVGYPRLHDRAAASAGTDIWKTLKPGKLKLRSAAALVVDEAGNEVYAKQENDPMPIASITKLMTAMVILDGDLRDGHPRRRSAHAGKDHHYQG